MRARLWSFGWLAALIAINVVIAADHSADNAPAAAVMADEQVPTTPSPAISVTPREIESAYEENTVAADEKYKGKSLGITGTAKEISTNITGEAIITMVGNDKMSDPVLNFVKVNLRSVAQIKPGQTISAICTGEGDSMKTPLLGNCTLE